MHAPRYTIPGCQRVVFISIAGSQPDFDILAEDASQQACILATKEPLTRLKLIDDYALAIHQHNTSKHLFVKRGDSYGKDILHISPLISNCNNPFAELNQLKAYLQWNRQRIVVDLGNVSLHSLYQDQDSADFFFSNDSNISSQFYWFAHCTLSDYLSDTNDNRYKQWRQSWKPVPLVLWDKEFCNQFPMCFVGAHPALEGLARHLETEQLRNWHNSACCDPYSTGDQIPIEICRAVCDQREILHRFWEELPKDYQNVLITLATGVGESPDPHRLDLLKQCNVIRQDSRLEWVPFAPVFSIYIAKCIKGDCAEEIVEPQKTPKEIIADIGHFVVHSWQDLLYTQRTALFLMIITLTLWAFIDPRVEPLNVVAATINSLAFFLSPRLKKYLFEEAGYDKEQLTRPDIYVSVALFILMIVLIYLILRQP